jgi:pimeloyl-ACP methyl ester carboxylesterase
MGGSLLEAQALGGYLRLAYHRAGFAGSSRIAGPISLSRHAKHCRLLMLHLGIERAHIVGHSSSAVIALQLALDYPDAVQTLVLMESARPTPPTEAQAEFVRAFVKPAAQRYLEGDKRAAVDTFFRGVFGPDYRVPLEEALPGAFECAVRDADAVFGQELPALQHWSFTEEDASRITQPALAVLGENTAPTFPGVGSCFSPGCQRRAVRPLRCDAPVAYAEPGRYGGGSDRLLRPTPARGRQRLKRREA